MNSDVNGINSNLMESEEISLELQRMWHSVKGVRDCRDWGHQDGADILPLRCHLVAKTLYTATVSTGPRGHGAETGITKLTSTPPGWHLQQIPSNESTRWK